MMSPTSCSLLIGQNKTQTPEKWDLLGALTYTGCPIKNFHLGYSITLEHTHTRLEMTCQKSDPDTPCKCGNVGM